MKTISILGCGWLGLPLAKHMIKRGFRVNGSTTDKNKIGILKKNLIIPYLLNIDPDIRSTKEIEDFFDAEFLYINFPPKRRDDIVEYHNKQISSLVDSISKSRIQKVIFASSTSVYPNTNSIVDENCKLTPEKNSGKALIEAEKMLLNESNFETTVIRFAGLIGYDRSPLRSIKRKKLVLNPHTKLNLIHRDDCIKLSEEIIDKGLWNETLNACCDNHPTRKEYYEKEANKHGMQLPDFDDSEKPVYKIVSNTKLKNLLDYELIYPDPLNIPFQNS